METTSPEAELMRWHHKLGHLSFNKIKRMAELGQLPKPIATARTPKCASCMFGKATKKPWRAKGQQKKLKTTTAPGQCISIDQLESTTPGLVAQMRGFLNTARYKYATVSVDHYSSLSYVHLQVTDDMKETIEAN